MSAAKRPLGIYLLVLLLVLDGISLIASYFFPDLLGDEAWLLWAFMAMGILYVIAAIGFLSSFKWAWYLTLGLSIIAATISIYYLDILDLLFDGLVIYYITRPRVRALFFRRSAKPANLFQSGAGNGNPITPPPPPPP